MTTSADIRVAMVHTLHRDLIGPGREDEDLAREVLPARPSRWYLTGFLVPARAEGDQRAPLVQEGELTSGEGAEGLDDSDEADSPSARPGFLPSSMGLSFLLPEAVSRVRVTVRWGDYRAVYATTPEETPLLADPASEGEDESAEGAPSLAKPARRTVWHRAPRAEPMDLSLPENDTAEHDVPNSNGLKLNVVVRPTRLRLPEGDLAVRSVSLFLVNRRAPLRGRRADEASAFQAALNVESDPPFISRQDARGYWSEDEDDRLADLHYRDMAELAVGHNVSADWHFEGQDCREVHTTWIPTAIVPRIVSAAPADVGCTLNMAALGALPDFTASKAALEGMTRSYRTWIDRQRAGLLALAPKRREVAEGLLTIATRAAVRIQDGIVSLSDPLVLDAFRIANRAVSAAAARRTAHSRGLRIEDVNPAWRPFQLAFLLLNLRGLVEPAHVDRKMVDLLFFPTGGGKTEAYLGLSAFAIALRRLRNPGIAGAGLTVLMRYTLRLLTLDQLQRAAGLVCALELEREKAPERLGTWKIEIGLWVGSAATPNKMGRKGEPDPRRRAVRLKVLNFVNNTKKHPQPLPIERCPWCGTPFGEHSFRLKPDANAPTTLDLFCMNRACDFYSGKGRAIPLHAVDEPIYRRLPAFMIATVDKFAGMPWTGEIAGFFGKAERYDGEGFYSAAEPGRGQPLPKPLHPPDLVIQDELHLISGPLGSMTGLYETALDALCARTIDGKEIRPKIVASTATVRRAEKQIQALFDRPFVQVFPPPGSDRRDSFFAKGLPDDDPGGRLYLGLAAPGISPRVTFLKALVTLMSSAQYAWDGWRGPAKDNPADPYMTVVAYFNALRELGGANRLVQEQVRSRLELYGHHRRIGEVDAGFANRTIFYEPAELSSRIATNQISRVKDRLAAGFADSKQRIDVALATNMISVGLDIERLGLMAVSGQPKTTAEYIQSTSRVGRDENKPGLVVTLLNMAKPRDRSHYERFKAFHGSFYRSVEPTSVTPFSPRALDRGLAAVTVALARLGVSALTPQIAAARLKNVPGSRAEVVAAVTGRAGQIDPSQAASAGMRIQNLMDAWERVADNVAQAGGSLGYGRAGVARPLLHEVLETGLRQDEAAFRAGRSLRDVEPGVLVEIIE